MSALPVEQTGWNKPFPGLDTDTRQFWEACRRHELSVQRCRDCGGYEWPPSLCNSCGSANMEWAQVSGDGTVFSFVVFRKLYHPGFADEIPYNVAIIELAEGPLLQSNIVDCPNDEIQVGMPVSVTYEDISEEFTLHRFRRSETR